VLPALRFPLDTWVVMREDLLGNRRHDRRVRDPSCYKGRRANRVDGRGGVPRGLRTARLDPRIAGDAPTSDAPIEVPVDASPLAGCTLYLPMDETSWNGTTGEVHDACGGLHAGTATAATTKVDPVRGRVGGFSASACVTIPDAPALHATSALTLSAWVRPTQLAPGQDGLGIISKRTDVGVDSEYSLFVWSDTTSMTTNQVWLDTANDRVNDPNFVLLDDAWHQITTVYDGTLATGLRLRVYIDGALSQVAPVSSSSIAPPAAEPDLAIGCLPRSGLAQGFIGDLDDIAVWTRALDDAEVTAWFVATTR
jgi:hypothetical protein